MAKAVRNKTSFEPMEQQIGQDRPRNMPSTGKARIEPPLIDVVDGPNWKDKADALAFLEENVTIVIMDTSDKNAEFLVPLWVNGRSQYIFRNQPTDIKRKFVEALARAKETTYTQEYYKDANNNNAIRNIPHTALKYPFTILHDANPRGPAWLKKILAEF